MARAPKISSSSPLAKPAENSGDRRVEMSGRQSARPCSSTWLRRPAPATGSQLSSSNSILAGLPREELTRLKPRLQPVSWHCGQILVDVATPLDCFYFPESGMVCRFAVTDDGRTVALAAVGREGFLGVPAFLGAESAQLRAVVLIEGDAVKLSQDDLRRILPVSPQFVDSLRRYSSGYLAQIATLGACHALHSVHHRVASWLLMAHDGANSNTLPLTHESLSELLGCRRASVTGALSLLQNAGVINCAQGHISILDHSRLSQHACECYASLKRHAASA